MSQPSQYDEEEHPDSVESPSPSAQEVEALLRELLGATQSRDVQTHLREALGKLPAEVSDALNDLAVALKRICQSNGDAGEVYQCFKIVADASREVKWRAAFGPLRHGRGAESVLGSAVSSLRHLQNYGDDTISQISRLVANCCADMNENRAFVIGQNVVSLLIEHLSESRQPDKTVVTLYNICLDFEDPSVEKSEEIRVNDAQRQLARAKGMSGLNSLVVMMASFEALSDSRKDLLANLIEIASHAALESLDFLFNRDAVESSDQNNVHMTPIHQTLRMLLTGPGRRIAAHSEDCCISICNAVANFLSTEEAKRVVVELDLIVDLLNLPYQYDERSRDAEDESLDSLEDLIACRGRFLRVIYDVTGTPEFSSSSALSSTWIRPQVIDKLKECNVGHIENCRPSPAYLYLVLANAITSVSDAEKLVQEDHIHESVVEVLAETADPDLLFIVTGLLVKLTLSDTNTLSLVESGAFESLHRLLETRTSIQVKREAVLATRLMIKGWHKAQSVREIAARGRPEGGRDASSDAALNASLDLFRDTTDGATKLEVGRLVIEVCRTLFGSADGGSRFMSMLGPQTQQAADAVVCVLSFGQESAKSEGWFGLGMLSAWKEARNLVSSALQEEGVLAELRKTVRSKSGPSFENVCVLLVNLLAADGDEISSTLRQDLQRIASELGLV